MPPPPFPSQCVLVPWIILQRDQHKNPITINIVHKWFQPFPQTFHCRVIRGPAQLANKSQALGLLSIGRQFESL